jgi:hypothetical protein
MYFESEEGVNLKWKVIREHPRMSIMKDAICVYVWFTSSNIIVTVDFLKFAAISVNKFEMVVFTAFL